MSAPNVAAWNQAYDVSQLGHNLMQAQQFRTSVLSIAGSVAGVLGLQNLAGFGFLVASVIVCNLVLIFVMAHGQPGTYFDLRPAPVFASELECLIPDKAAQLRQPMSTSATLLRLARFVVWQGLPENVLGFILWWTFWFGIVHVYD